MMPASIAVFVQIVKVLVLRAEKTCREMCHCQIKEYIAIRQELQKAKGET
jgi:hypothetical protein